MRILKIRKSVERRSQLLPIKEYLTGENFCLDEFMDMVSRMEKMGLLSRCRPILPIESVSKRAMCVKFWRKRDFESLAEWVSQKYKFIDVQKCL